MVNYVLSFCKITGASRLFSRNFYLPLLKPLTPKEALRTLRITGKWLLGAKIQHYIPVLLNHRKKRSKHAKNFGKKPHETTDDFTYMAPVLDSDNESHKLLLAILENKNGTGTYVYSVDDKKYNIVLQAQLEKAILDGDVIDILVSQKTDKIIVKLKSLKKIPMPIEYYEGSEEMYCGEGSTSEEDEKFHHHGKYTMGLAKIFEDKEMLEEKWEEELKKIMKRRKRQKREGSKDWKEMMKETMKNLDWAKFEEEAKKVIEEIEEPALEDNIEMDIDDLESTKNVNETVLNHMDKLPTMKEIPDIIKSMAGGTLDEIEVQSECGETKRVSGIKVTLSSGKECFVSGQMVHTEDGDVFVPGQTIENEFGLEYAPGITINIDNKPTLINGLIMGEEERDPMFLPTESTITADGQLTFASSPEERPAPPPPEKRKLKKRQVIEEIAEEPEIILTEDEEEDVSVDEESRTSSDEELDAEALRLKQEQQRLEIEKLKAILMDDGLDDVIASIEEKRAKLQQKLEELRKLNINTEKNLVSYISDGDAAEIADKISTDPDIINRLTDILMTMTRRAATFRDKNSINAENINQIGCCATNLTSKTDLNFQNSSNKLQMLLKTAIVSANDVFKNRPKDQALALSSIGEIIVDVLKNDPNILDDLLAITKTSKQRHELLDAIFKQLTQNNAETKVYFINSIASKKSSEDDVLNNVEKILAKTNEIKYEAFCKIAKTNPELIENLVSSVKKDIHKVKSEETAEELLENAIEEAIATFLDKSLRTLLFEKAQLCEFQQGALSLATTLGLSKIEQTLYSTNLDEIQDRSTLTFLQRVILINLLGDKDFSSKCALDRVKKNPERARSDPRIRQLVRESASLLKKTTTLRNSRDIPIQFLKTQNHLAMEDFLMQKAQLEYPVLICRDTMQAVIPKDATRSVLAGRVPYVLVDESGVTNFKFPACSRSRENSIIEDYLTRDRSSERKYLQAKSNVRKLKKLLNHNSSRQVA